MIVTVTITVGKDRTVDGLWLPNDSLFVRFLMSTQVQQVYAAYGKWKHQHMRMNDYDNKTILQTSAGTQEGRLVIKIHSCFEWC